jgi:hypothetical protein
MTMQEQKKVVKPTGTCDENHLPEVQEEVHNGLDKNI